MAFAKLFIGVIDGLYKFYLGALNDKKKCQVFTIHKIFNFANIDLKKTWHFVKWLQRGSNPQPLRS